MTLSNKSRGEKRQHRRLKLFTRALVKKKGAGFIFSGELADVSNTGAYLTTNCPLAKGDIFDLTIYFQHGRKKLSVTVPCKVARVDGKGVGLTSSHIDANLLLRLEFIFDVRKGNTIQLVEEFFQAICFVQEWE